MAEYEYSKYIATKETLRNTIDTYGVAIIPNVLDEEEYDRGKVREHAKFMEFFQLEFVILQSDRP